MFFNLSDNHYVLTRGKAVQENRTIKNYLRYSHKFVFACIFAIRDSGRYVLGEERMQLNYLFIFFLLQRTSVVSSSVEQNGCAIQKQSRYDRAQRAHHKESEILAELRTGPER